MSSRTAAVIVFLVSVLMLAVAFSIILFAAQLVFPLPY